MTGVEDLTVAILAGGLGTRLRSKVADRPKVLAEVRGRPFLAYLLDQVSDMGARRVVLCTGYRGKQIQAAFGDNYKSLQLVYSQETSPLGTAGALRLALPLLHSDPVLVMNGDSFCAINLDALLAWYLTNSPEAALVLTNVLDTARYGRVEITGKGPISGFIEKAKDTNRPGWINAGIYLLSRKFLQAIPVDKALSLEQEVFPTWVGRGLYGFPSVGDFLDIGVPEAYGLADRFFAGASRS